MNWRGKPTLLQLRPRIKQKAKPVSQLTLCISFLFISKENFILHSAVCLKFPEILEAILKSSVPNNNHNKNNRNDKIKRHIKTASQTVTSYQSEILQSNWLSIYLQQLAASVTRWPKVLDNFGHLQNWIF